MILFKTTRIARNKTLSATLPFGFFSNGQPVTFTEMMTDWLWFYFGLIRKLLKNIVTQWTYFHAKAELISYRNNYYKGIDQMFEREGSRPWTSANTIRVATFWVIIKYVLYFIVPEYTILS